jgi:hypothetical protein
MEEEAASKERVAQSEAKALAIQCKRQVLTLQLADIQAELQCHQCNHAGFVGSTWLRVLLRREVDAQQESEN